MPCNPSACFRLLVSNMYEATQAIKGRVRVQPLAGPWHEL